MNIYTITVPGQNPVDVQGLSIRTEIVQIQTPPPLPAFFTVYAVQPAFNQQPFNPNAIVNQALSYAYPVIRQTPFFQTGYCQIWITFTGSNGLTYEVGSSTSAVYICNSFTITPGLITVDRCDVIVTVDSSGNEIRINGVEGQPCPTWTIRTLDDCRDTEIKCVDLSDPRGFCCIPCDTLNTKLRALIL